MPSYLELSTDILQQMKIDLNQKYSAAKAAGLKLNITRGKPCPEQLDLANGLLTALDETDYIAADGTDCHKYMLRFGIQHVGE